MTAGVTIKRDVHVVFYLFAARSSDLLNQHAILICGLLFADTYLNSPLAEAASNSPTTASSSSNSPPCPQSYWTAAR